MADAAQRATADGTVFGPVQADQAVVGFLSEGEFIRRVPTEPTTAERHRRLGRQHGGVEACIVRQKNVLVAAPLFNFSVPVANEELSTPESQNHFISVQNDGFCYSDDGCAAGLSRSHKNLPGDRARWTCPMK